MKKYLKILNFNLCYINNTFYKLNNIMLNKADRIFINSSRSRRL